MTEKLTPAEFAILGLVAEAPRHGYEIEQVIAERGMRDWTEIAFSSIYFLLAGLKRRGLIAPQPAAGTRRKVFAATGEGRAALADAVGSALERPEPFRSPFLVALANWPAVGGEKGRAALGERVRMLAAAIADLEARAAHPMPGHAAALFDYSLALMRAELAWLRTSAFAKGDCHDQARPAQDAESLLRTDER